MVCITPGLFAEAIHTEKMEGWSGELEKLGTYLGMALQSPQTDAPERVPNLCCLVSGCARQMQLIVGEPQRNHRHCVTCAGIATLL